MSIRREDLPFIFKIFSLLIILLVFNVRNKMNIDLQLANKIEIKEYNDVNLNMAAQKFVKTSVYKGVGWENIEAVNK